MRAVEEAYGRVLAVPAVEVKTPEALITPVFDMEKRVVVAKAAVEEEMTKSVVGVVPTPALELAARMESVAYGELVPMPRNPAAVKVEVAVPPKYATCEEN